MIPSAGVLLSLVRVSLCGTERSRFSVINEEQTDLFALFPRDWIVEEELLLSLTRSADRARILYRRGTLIVRRRLIPLLSWEEVIALAVGWNKGSHIKCWRSSLGAYVSGFMSVVATVNRGELGGQYCATSTPALYSVLRVQGPDTSTRESSAFWIYFS